MVNFGPEDSRERPSFNGTSLIGKPTNPEVSQRSPPIHQILSLFNAHHMSQGRLNLNVEVTRIIIFTVVVHSPDMSDCFCRTYGSTAHVLPCFEATLETLITVLHMCSIAFRCPHIVVLILLTLGRPYIESVEVSKTKAELERLLKPCLCATVKRLKEQERRFSPVSLSRAVFGPRLTSTHRCGWASCFLPAR